MMTSLYSVVMREEASLTSFDLDGSVNKRLRDEEIMFADNTFLGSIKRPNVLCYKTRIKTKSCN